MPSPALAAGDRDQSPRTRSYFITALCDYHSRYGECTAACFSPGAAKRNGRPDLVERYYTPREDGEPWPSLNSIKKAFGGSFNVAMRAAGLPVNSTMPPGGRRRPGEAMPILTVRERRVVVTRQQDASPSAERVQTLEAEIARLRDELRRATSQPAGTRNVVARAPDRRLERTVARVRERLAAETAARRAAEKRVRAAAREERPAVERERKLRAEVDAARAHIAGERADRERLERELAQTRAITARQERDISGLRAELDAAHARIASDVQAATRAELVAIAEDRAVEAEKRAAAIERRAVAQAAALTGKQRMLTAAEMVELRSHGPAGPGVMADALTKLRAARAGHGDLDAALVDVMRAARGWVQLRARKGA